MKKLRIIIYMFCWSIVFLFTQANSVSALEIVNTYDGELGITYTSSSTKFKIWSSSASKINVIVEGENPQTIMLTKDSTTNVWTGYGEGDLLGKEYTYIIEYEDDVVYDNVLDPYGKYINENGDKNVIYDGNLIGFEEWYNQVNYLSIKDKNKIIYGLNVYNFTSSDSWGGSTVNKGKLLGLIEEGTKISGYSTGYDYIKNLGVTYIELSSINSSLLPFTVDSETVSGSTVSSGNLELKQLVNKYYLSGIGVILTFDIFDIDDSFIDNLAKIDRNYYINQEGNLDYNKEMTQKYFIDLFSYWVKEYKLSGIKFDNMSSINISLINTITEKLLEINDNIFLYGDGSYETNDENTAGEYNLDKLKNISMINGSFNYSMFGDLINNVDKGILEGNFSNEIIETLKFSFLSSVNNGQIDYTLVKGISYKEDWGNTSSFQLVNYMGMREGLSLYDKFLIGGVSSESIIKQKLILALGTEMNIGGIPYIYSGDEFLMSYYDFTSNVDSNSICANNNCFYKDESKKIIDWGYAYRNDDLVNDVRSLINFRKSNSSIIQTDSKIIKNNVDMYVNNEMNGVVGISRKYPNAYAKDIEEIFVVFNYSNNEFTIDDKTGKGWYGLYKYNDSNRSGDSISLKANSIYIEAKEKQPKINQWITLIIVLGLIGSIYYLNIILNRKLMEKRGYELKDIKKKYRPFMKNVNKATHDVEESIVDEEINIEENPNNNEIDEDNK